MDRLWQCLFILAFIFHCQAQRFLRPPRQDTSTCRTPKGENGSCIRIKQCAVLLNLLKTDRGNPATITLLQKSVCRYEASEPVVCCPSELDTKSSTISTTPQPAGPITTGSLPSPPNCGKSEGLEFHQKIVGGNPSVLGAWPWIAAIGYRSSTKPGPEWGCAGALINNRYVLTAAHCNDHPRLKMFVVRLGDLDLDNNVKDNATPLDIGIEKFIPHEKYDRKLRIEDIGLIRLKEDVTYTRLIKPICLPIEPEVRTKNLVRNFPFIAGWGATEFRGPSSTALLEIQIPVVDNESCKKSYARQGGMVIPKQLCAGYARGGKDACQGDSGGPLMWPKGDTFYLIGIVSYGYKCAEPGYPGVYTRVTEYVDWVEKTIK